MAKAAKKPLGRGLSALISTPPAPLKDVSKKKATVSKKAAKGDEVCYLKTTSIKANMSQPRKSFSKAELEELSGSIKTLGVIQPIIVRPVADEHDSYQIVAGERRWRAAKLAGLKQLPVIIRDLEDRASMEIALVENIQRENLNPVEEARAYQALIDEFSLSQQELADRLGKKRSSITNYLRILKLPNQILDLVSSNKITLGHAKAILSVKEPKAQISLASKVIKEELSVRDLEDIVGRVVVVAPRQKPKQRLEAQVAYFDLENRLKNLFGTKVKIKSTKNGSGSVAIEFYSEEELARIVDIIEK